MSSSLQRDCYSGYVQLCERELTGSGSSPAGEQCTDRGAAVPEQPVRRPRIGALLLRTFSDNRAELVARAYVEGVLDHDTWPPKLAGQTYLSVGASVGARTG